MANSGQSNFLIFFHILDQAQLAQHFYVLLLDVRHLHQLGSKGRAIEDALLFGRGDALCLEDDHILAIFIVRNRDLQWSLLLRFEQEVVLLDRPLHGLAHRLKGEILDFRDVLGGVLQHLLRVGIDCECFV